MNARRAGRSSRPFFFLRATAIESNGLDQALWLGSRRIVAHRRRWRRACSSTSIQAIDWPIGLRLPDLLIDVTDAALEFANSLSERRSDLRDSLRAENHEHDDENDRELHGA